MIKISITNFIYSKIAFMLILMIFYIITSVKDNKYFLQVVFVPIIVVLFIFLNIQKIGLYFFLTLLIVFFISHFLGCLIGFFIEIGYFFIVEMLSVIFYSIFLFNGIIIFIISYAVTVFIYKIIRWVI
ncbi:hypothetical protein DYQ05_08100 [Treponema pedis]|uniref:Uncharacterized protein n=1 Tax=Treponema pedis str. T A4 TaxID=1291379 RepID=S5ZNL8_9SPIR|nr:hypothetical protein TPE_0084 [Treponema pedis str. T A4]AGT44177.1 hypothetical protein TPE_1695 [Treponema pedis str. T A4]QSI03476.1 hypothetical protein DYQ05_00365 [Treponema pedis]QSI04890.1 hypothetical protein DYQ05_08100 [Treponema pedis]